MCLLSVRVSFCFCGNNESIPISSVRRCGDEMATVYTIYNTILQFNINSIDLAFKIDILLLLFILLLFVFAFTFYPVNLVSFVDHNFNYLNAYSHSGEICYSILNHTHTPTPSSPTAHYRSLLSISTSYLRLVFAHRTHRCQQPLINRPTTDSLLCFNISERCHTICDAYRCHSRIRYV